MLQKKFLDLKFYPGQTKIVKLQLDLELNMNELERTWTSRVQSWLCFPMSQEQQQEEEPHLILLYRIDI